MPRSSQRQGRPSGLPESRLSIPKCRALLEEAADGLSDREVESIRDQFYGVVRAAANAQARVQTPFNRTIAQMSSAERDAVEERAAIVEFDGKLSRDEAERTALAALISPIAAVIIP